MRRISLKKVTFLLTRECDFNVSNYKKWNFLNAVSLLVLNKALTTGQIPRKYKTIQKNQAHFRGRLCISKHIHANTPIKGIFTAPVNMESNNTEEIYTFTRHPFHQIGIVNLSLEDNTNQKLLKMLHTNTIATKL